MNEFIAPEINVAEIDLRDVILGFGSKNPNVPS